MNTTTRRVWLDWLRGILSLAIILQHVRWLTSGDEYWWGRMQLVVNCFIVLAGWSAAMSWRPQSWSHYVARRVTRLYPTYAVCLWFGILVSGIPSLYDFVAHVFLVHGMIPDALSPGLAMSIVEPAWFVSLLFQLILLTPLLMRISEANLWRLFALSLCVLFHFANWRLYQYVSPIGATAIQKGYLYIAGILAYRYFGRGFSISNERLALLAAPVAFIGRISYPLFLLHFPILMLLAQRHTNFQWLLFGYPISIGAAWVVWRYVEGGGGSAKVLAAAAASIER
jgi:peptidoglycan/LPS O-acetylase OafA/YrhL